MLLVDFSQIYISSCIAFESDFQKGSDSKRMEDIARHVILNVLKSYNMQHKKKYGQMVLCVDGRNTWRRDKFPYYKANRKTGREESPLDWEAIMEIGAKVREEIAAVFPWKVVHVTGAEGDDVIACLLKHSQEHWLNQDGLMESPQDMLVISSDHDFRQLSKYKNYNQWSPIQKKAVPRAHKTFLLEKILDGDKGDGIPSIMCPDDFLVNKDKYGRAPSLTQKIIDAFLANPDGSTLTEQQKINFARNKMLIDFDCIPDEVYNNIISAYDSFEITGSKQKAMDYFIKFRLKQHLQDIHSFF